MAKEQQLSLNPNKISGICGRLMCCLTYEYSSYQELRKSLPKVGKRLQAPEGEGKIIRYNFIRETVTLEMEDRREVEFSLTELGIGDAAPVRVYWYDAAGKLTPAKGEERLDNLRRSSCRSPGLGTREPIWTTSIRS